MPTTKQEQPLMPSGALKHLNPTDIAFSEDNPRRLFDPEPLKDLRDNIRLHGVLVPITVYQVKGQDKYRILDGERRHKCCLDLLAEGISRKIPANIVDPPDKLARLLYMFSIHNFREGWELMPVALGLKLVIKELGEKDPKKLNHLTGLSMPQIERCFVLLSFPEKFQKMSLDPDPAQRIPSNFWIEARPVIDLIQSELPKIYADFGESGITERLVDKYRAKAIKSVIHFRRIIEAFDNAQGSEEKADVGRALQQYILEINAETRYQFDRFVLEERKIQGAIAACDEFSKVLRKLKLENMVDRDKVIVSLEDTRDYINSILERMKGSDEPLEAQDELDV